MTNTSTYLKEDWFLKLIFNVEPDQEEEKVQIIRAVCDVICTFGVPQKGTEIEASGIQWEVDHIIYNYSSKTMEIILIQ